LNNLKERINRFRLLEHFKYQKIDKNQLNEIIETALKSNCEIPNFNTTGDVPPFEELYKIVEILISRGYDKIYDHYLPLTDISIIDAKAIYEKDVKRNIHQKGSIQYGQEQAQLYIEYFFKYLESCYKDFVEYSFPTFKEDFVFYKNIPHEYYFYMKDSDIRKWGMYGYRPSESGKLRVNIKESMPFSSDKPFKEDGVKSLRGFSLESILNNNSNFDSKIKTIDKINTPKVDTFCVLRNWVYKLLENDMKHLFKDND